MIAYKAFQKDLSCLGYQYQEAEWNYTEKAACRKTGFHCVLFGKLNAAFSVRLKRVFQST